MQTSLGQWPPHKRHVDKDDMVDCSVKSWFLTHKDAYICNCSHVINLDVLRICQVDMVTQHNPTVIRPRH